MLLFWECPYWLLHFYSLQLSTTDGFKGYLFGAWPYSFFDFRSLQLSTNYGFKGRLFRNVSMDSLILVAISFIKCWSESLVLASCIYLAYLASLKMLILAGGRIFWRIAGNAWELSHVLVLARSHIFNELLFSSMSSFSKAFLRDPYPFLRGSYLF